MHIPSVENDSLPAREGQRLSEQLAQAQRLESLGRLAGGVAHEFNNLLQAIKGYANLALHALDPNSQAADDLRQVTQAADRAATITNQLLRFSRRDANDKTTIDLNATVETLGKMLGPLLGRRIQVRWSLADDAGSIQADSGMLDQVLMNLCLNARDAMPRGGTLTIATSRVTLSDGDACPASTLGPGTYAVLTVRDTGCGIPRQLQQCVFEPFFTTKNAGQGTGLGLTAVHGMVQQHGGTVTLESEPGLGTTFRVYLPAEPIQDETSPSDSDLELVPS